MHSKVLKSFSEELNHPDYAPQGGNFIPIEGNHGHARQLSGKKSLGGKGRPLLVGTRLSIWFPFYCGRGFLRTQLERSNGMERQLGHDAQRNSEAKYCLAKIEIGYLQHTL